MINANSTVNHADTTSAGVSAEWYTSLYASLVNARDPNGGGDHCSYCNQPYRFYTAKSVENPGLGYVRVHMDTGTDQHSVLPGSTKLSSVRAESNNETMDNKKC